MKDFSNQYPKRHFDVMFYVDDDALKVRKVQAFICENNDSRWVPEMGYSVSPNFHVFWTKEEAEKALRKMARRELPEATRRLHNLQVILK